ncbi:alpha/beta hydrolase [Paenibacillus aurantius]|uniref:Alpha/beta hydrolase n=1 Tax=Paenibacillus aurantius TaxID=2918900 RepID=A0AA96LCX4_9BACL|nr:alpha/beta hydrolase [Paenibacillus aurantius]WNQ10883.1 alpha/beta hydrolase [Paenibacillus aurantius]
MKERKQEEGEYGLVFVHGAGLRSEVWEGVVKNLGLPYLLADLPRRNEPVEARGELTLEDYAASLREQIRAWPVPRVVLVAHSLGGVVALRAASGLEDRLAGFAAVGAAIPRDGGSFVSALPWPKRLILSVVLKKMGTRPPESMIRAGLCSDLAPEQASKVVKAFVPEAVRAYTDRCEAAVPSVPRLYMKLTKDKEFSSSLQDRMIRHLQPNRVAELATGHLPMLSDPDGLRRVLEHFLAEEVMPSGVLA